MLDELQTRLRYHFKKSALLEEAITHRSYLNEHANYPYHHNERLEFLGDAVLGFIASDFIYRRFPTMPEGRMTRLRAWLVRTETLAGFARQIELGGVIRMAKGEEDTGGRDRQTLLCNGFEAIIGAVYLDSGLGAAREFIMPFLEQGLFETLAADKDKDPKSLFQEWIQALYNITPSYHTLAALGTEHDRMYAVELRVGDIGVGWGMAHNKQIAEQDAATQALGYARMGSLFVGATSDIPVRVSDLPLPQ